VISLRIGKVSPKKRLKKCGLLDLIKIHVLGSGKPPKHLDLENDPDINFLGEVECPGPYIRGSDVVIVPVRNPSGGQSEGG
jgi:hypothetical protein